MGSSTYDEPSERSPKKATRRAPGRTARGDGSPAPVAAAAPRVADPPVARPSPEHHRAALSRVEAPPYAAERAALLLALQQSYGNRYVQRLLSDAPPDAPADGAIGRREAGGASGRPLEPRVRGDMEDRFGASFPAIRVHTDEDAADAARTLGARAFTTGQDIYFSRGAYRPETPEGKHLLAHELTHTLQQRHAPAGAQSALEVVPPDDPLEREADRVAHDVTRGRRALPVATSTLSPARALVVQRQPADASAQGAAAPAGVTSEGDFVIAVGGLKVKKEEIEAAAAKGKYERDLSTVSLPGLKPKRLVVALDRNPRRARGGYVTAELDVPFVKKGGGGGLKLSIDKEGKVSVVAKAKLDVPALNNPELELTVEEGQLAGQVTLTGEKLKPRGIPKLKIPEASVTVGIGQGKLHGEGHVALEYTGLAKGDFTVEFKDGEPAGKGRVDLTPDYLKGVAAEITISKGNLEGALTLPAPKLAPPVPGLKITDGTITVGMKNGELSGKGDNVAFEYKSLGAGTLGFSIVKDHVDGSGTLNLTIPGLAPIKGELRYTGGRLSGKATITADKFPKALPVKSGSITAIVDENAAIAGKGAVAIGLFGLGSGELKLGYEKGILDIGAEVTLTKIPGLEEGRVRVGLKDGALEGEGEIAIAPKQIPGLAGNLLVVYKEDRFSGHAKLGYAKDKFAGWVELFLAQNEKGKMAMSGSGEVTARLTDWLTGMVHIDVLEDASTRIAGELKADDIKIFDEKKADRELFKVEQHIPLWAILVAVIRLRGGVRAGVGPGWLRGVTARGQFSTVEGEEPSFSITGELYIPAYAEAYIAFGAGLGLDVVIGSLTGGIEAVGTAGIYGAVSVIPEIDYANGDFTITGVATLAAGAKVKLGLQAWAEVEAFWITVWSDEWKLAEWVWDVGPELAMQASMKYVFGHPEPPSFDFKTSDIDAHKLIQDAMPKDGPAGSGAREALKNTAEWKGALKQAAAKDASAIPPDLAAKSAKAPEPKALPPKPPKSAPPADLKAKDPAKVKEMLGKELDEKGGPAKVGELDKAHQEKFDTGMLALQKLHDRAEGDPENPQEIEKDLAEIKAKYGFTTLTHELQGDKWLVDAAMSPGKKVWIAAGQDNPRELLVGTFNDLQGPVGDKMTPDHEPQNALMTYLSDLRYKNVKPFKGTSVENYTRGQGICLNMHEDRHKQTRTYGGSGTGTKNEAITEMTDNLDKLPVDPDLDTYRENARKVIAKTVKGALKKDHAFVTDIYNNSLLPQKTKNRLDAALTKVKSVNKAAWPEAFSS